MPGGRGCQLHQTCSDGRLDATTLSMDPPIDGILPPYDRDFSSATHLFLLLVIQTGSIDRETEPQRFDHFTREVDFCRPQR